MRFCATPATPTESCSLRPRNCPPNCSQTLPAIRAFVPIPHRKKWSNSPAGVTEAFAGVARTGSVCIDVGYQRTGMVSLLAPLQIAVVAAENHRAATARPVSRDVLDGKGLKRDFVFITGPSATADMGPLVRGVHGPHQTAHHRGEVNMATPLESRRHSAAAGGQQERQESAARRHPHDAGRAERRRPPQHADLQSQPLRRHCAHRRL